MSIIIVNDYVTLKKRFDDESLHLLIIIENDKDILKKRFSSKVKCRVSDFSRGWPEGSLFNSYYTKV